MLVMVVMFGIKRGGWVDLELTEADALLADTNPHTMIKYVSSLFLVAQLDLISLPENKITLLACGVVGNLRPYFKNIK